MLVRPVYSCVHCCPSIRLAYPTIFEELTYKEIEAAREHLSKPIKESGNQNGKRIFNLDVAKLL